MGETEKLTFKYNSTNRSRNGTIDDKNVPYNDANVPYRSQQECRI